MDDDRLLAWAGQSLRLRACGTFHDQNHPDTTIEWHEAVGVPLNAGSRVRLEDEGREVATFAVGHAIMKVDRFPNEAIHAIRLPDGSMLPVLTTTARGVAIPYIQEMIARYEAILGPVIASENTEPIVIHVGPGRPRWSGSPFVDEADCIAWLKAAATGALQKQPKRQPTQQLALSWLADHHPAPEHFRHADPKRITDWCAKAGRPWEAIKRDAIAEYDAGFAGVNSPPSLGR
jgi:hypothetical protein